MAGDRRGLVVDDLVLRLLRASVGVVMVALLVSGGTGVAVGAASPDPRESVHSPPVVDLAEHVAADTRTQRADECRAPLQRPSAVEGDVVYAYDYRPDFARPPPDEAAADAYDTAANSAEPPGSLGRVRRVSSGLVHDTVAPGSARPLSVFSRSTVDDAVVGVAQPYNKHISVGARALDKRASSVPFRGIDATTTNAQAIVRDIPGNPTRTVFGSKTYDVYNSLGQGARFDVGTNRFITFLDGTIAT